MSKFLENKYTIWYYNIVNNANSRDFGGYTEKHHIVPRSLGGDNSKSNLVKLTAREHFICHLLLTKMVTGVERSKMCYAAHMLGRTRNTQLHGKPKFKVNSRLYEILSIQQSEYARTLQKGRTLSEETKRKVSVANKGKFVSEETRKRMSRAQLGSEHSEETKKKLSKKAKQRHMVYISCLKCKVTLDIRNYYRLHNDNCGKKQSPSWNKGKSMPWKGSTLEKKECLHCGKYVDNGNYARWHGDNCKELRKINDKKVCIRNT